MQLLLTNDDGVDAEGLAALRTVAEHLLGERVAGERVGRALVVAPAECHSGCSHRVTTDEPFRVTRRSADCYVVHGTPADCVRVGLLGVAQETTWILSGINHGGNLGADVHLSGTVAAVREGVLHGRPGIAVSHYHRRGVEPLDWQRAAEWLTPVIRDIIAQPWTPGVFWNINLPHLPAGAPRPQVVHCRVDPSPLPVGFQIDGEMWKYNGNYHLRPKQAGADVDVCFQGGIAVTRIEMG